ncbi:MAG: hypothetical protein QOE70_6050 [Chthoniobacter sp.]|jgi:hypothetical protein|nr:hypothetical protein [Chthoniobacter sp.]
MILAAITQAATPAPELIKDIAPPVEVFPYPLWMVVTAGILAVLLLAGLVALIWYWLKRRPPPPPPTPRAIALRGLEGLRGKVQALDPYAFSIAVSDVLRTYIGAEYRLHAPQQTSPEFLASISKSVKFSDSDRQLLAGFLERCDLIKFARIDADAAESSRLLESAFDFVRGSRG